MENKFEYREGIVPYFKNVGFHVVPAIILGVICEKITHYVQTKYNLRPWITIILQLLLITLILYTIEIHISQSYASQWQDITPGFIFVSIFFGLQLSLYNNIVLLTTV
jgi:hypothetical protein